MQKLGAIDANFLYTESDLVHNHVASVQRFELPEDVTAGEYVSSFKDYILERSHLVPYMTRKLKFVPGNFDHPVWVRDEKFSIDNHVIEVPLAAPGSHAQLEKKVAELHARRMDRSRPLWAIYVITGLEDGSIAFYNQVHHSAIDGMAGQAATMMIFDNTPDHPPVEPPSDSSSDTSDLASLLQLTFENLLTYQARNTARMLGGMESMRKLYQRAIDPSKDFGAFMARAPKTRFNNSIGKERTYSVGEFELSDVRKMGKALGCSVNDVFMAVCAGGLRRYLKRHGDLPETGLIAGCPVSLRVPGEKRMGNQITMMNVNLSTHIEDPKLRLLEIHESATTAKSVTADLADGYDANVSLPGLPAMMAMAAASAERTRAADVIQSPMNVVISNVPGPREALYANQAKMLTHYPVSIPAHGVGLNITVQSYAGTMYFAITACAKALPESGELRDDMIASFLELRQLLTPQNVSAFPVPAAAAPVKSPADEEESTVSKVA